jgi:hypothetical protein
MGLPSRDVPPGWLDYIYEVRGYGDVFTPTSALRPADPALAGPPPTSQADLVRRAAERAAELRMAGRVLVDAAAYPDPVDWLLAPLAAGSSIVLCGRLDRAVLPARIRDERVDTTLVD